MSSGAQGTTPAPEGFCAWVMDGGGGAERVSPQAGLQANGDGKTVWFNIDFSDPIGREWLKKESGIPRPVVVAMLAEDSRPRVLEMDEGVLTILRGVNLNPGAQV